MTVTEIVATDVGGSHLCSAIVDVDSAEIVSSSFHNTYYDAFASRESIISVWRKHFSQFKNFKSFAIALPGPFDYHKGKAHYFSGHKLGELTGQSFFDIFQNEILNGSVDLKFENDAKCFGLGAAMGIEDHQTRNILFLTLGTGLGSCIINAAKLIEDSNEMYQMKFQNGTADDYFSTRWFVNYMHQRNGIIYEGVREIIETAEEKIVNELFQTFAANLHDFLFPTLRKHKIDTILLGGSISKVKKLIKLYLVPKLQNENIELSFVSDTLACSLKGAASLYKVKYEGINRL